jgi:hypothetical protein
MQVGENIPRIRRDDARRRLGARRLRRAALAAGLIGSIAFVIGLVAGAGGGGEDDPSTATSEPAPAELPRGGTELLPRYRLVGYYGAPQDEALGALGIGSPAAASAKLAKQARAYEIGDRPVMPFLELLATVANAAPGDDGLYRSRQPSRVIDNYLEQARADDEILVLDVQPGRASFRSEVERLRPWLREPDVGLGLDPEWHVEPGEVPGQVIGSIDAAEVNAVARGLSRMIARRHLPQKVLIVHRFTAEMVNHPERLKTYPGVAIVLNVDGFGTAADKIAKYRELHVRNGTDPFSGFKLFFEEDSALMTPEDVLGLKPEPDLVVYE